MGGLFESSLKFPEHNEQMDWTVQGISPSNHGSCEERAIKWWQEYVALVFWSLVDDWYITLVIRS